MDKSKIKRGLRRGAVLVLVLALRILRADDVRDLRKGEWIIRKLHLK